MPAGSVRRRLTIRFAGELRTVAGPGDLSILDAPPCLLGELNAGRLATRLGPASYRAYVFRLGTGVAVAVPAAVRAGAQVAVGAWVEAAVTLRTPRLDRRVPPDVRAALDRAGLDIAVLSAADRRQSLELINESRDPGVRAARIGALLASCATGST